MKNHKFWAWAAVICMVMAFYTGYKHKWAKEELLTMMDMFCKLDGKKTGIFAAGVLFGTAGIKVLSSKDAKKIYVSCTAAVLRAKECIMRMAGIVQENAEDIYSEAVEVNKKRAAEEIELEFEDESEADENLRETPAAEV